MLEHGVAQEDAARAAAQRAPSIEPLDDDGPHYRELRLGSDTRARLLEK